MIINIITENEVTLEKVRLIDENGIQMGEISLKEAFLIAKDRKLDLAIVSDKGDVKIAKIINYGKILYEQKKNKKNQKIAPKLKEIKFGLNVSEHDYQIKINKIIELLNEGDKVRVYLVLKGREVDYFEMAESFMQKVIDDLKGIGNTNDKIRLDGRNIILNFNKEK